MYDSKIIVNDIATRSFRTVADQDYILARLAYKHSLLPQFVSSAHQSIEKYLKAILLYNGIITKDLGHNLELILQRVYSIDHIEFDFTEPVLKFVKYLDRQGQNRYLEGVHYTRGLELIQLDRAVWEIRRYCKPLNYELTSDSGETKNMLSVELNKIHSWLDREDYHNFKIFNGHLENVIKKKDHPNRAPLIWNNFFYGSKKRNSVKIARKMNAINPTHIMHPEHFKKLDELIWFPKDVREYCLSKMQQ